MRMLLRFDTMELLVSRGVTLVLHLPPFNNFTSKTWGEKNMKTCDSAGLQVCTYLTTPTGAR